MAFTTTCFDSNVNPSNVAPFGACRPWIFFINGVPCFLKMNGCGMEKEERDDWRRHFKEKMSQNEAHHHKKPWIRA